MSDCISREALLGIAEQQGHVTVDDILSCEAVKPDLGWISVKDRLPENEKDVLIAFPRKGFHGDVHFCVAMAFRTDGQTNTEDSAYTWEGDYIDMDYDETADAYIIPEGWWEAVSFGEEFSAVDMPVTHWMPLPEPPKEAVHGT